MPEEISLQEFCDGMQKRLATFERGWKARKDDANYPQSMELGEWEEQLLCFDFDEDE